MNNEVIGILAGALSCTTFLPQVIKTWESKSTRDVSLTTTIATIGHISHTFCKKKRGWLIITAG